MLKKNTSVLVIFLLLVLNQSKGQTIEQANKLFDSGNIIQASKTYQKLLPRLIEEEGKCSVKNLEIVYRIANALIVSKKYDQSLSLLLRFKDCKSGISTIYNVLGVTYGLKKINDSAVYYYKKALRLSRSKQKAKIYNNLAVIYSTENIDSCHFYYKIALNYYYSTNDSIKIARTYNNLGKSFVFSGDFNKALECYQKSVSINPAPLSHVERELRLEALISKTEILPDINLILKADSLTKKIQDKIKYRADKIHLSDQLSRVINLGLVNCYKLYKQFGSKRYLNLLFYFTERSKANILLDEINSRDSKTSIIEVINLDAIQKKLSFDKVLLSYVQNNSSLYGFAITKTRVVFKHLGNYTKEELSDKVKSFQGDCQSINPRDFLKSAPKLYKLFIKPFEGVLKGKTHLLIIPTPEIMNTPFEAFVKAPPLPNPDIAPANQVGQALENAKYLMKDYFIRYHLSATLAFRNGLTVNKRKVYPVDFTALAQTSFNEEIRSLKYSKREVSLAGAYFIGNRKSVLFDNAANTQILKNLKSKILHISTHGHYKFSGKLLSGLLLKTSEGVIDTLFANDVYDLDLDIDLAVLSGCYSGRGRVESVEGVLGFNRALVYNNVPYIVFSSWQAYEQPSVDFFKLFYKYVTIGKYTYIEALALTKRAIVKRAPAYPAFWAGFMMIGR